ncbi:uncharacterized protein LOC134677693 [Cydia fagiglandana]|uniref:uncharacterized protein LOC134677693 n=1 Tax=Cydia fagiglandana TaxID=1458189 RepID=UPI002FEDF120
MNDPVLFSPRSSACSSPVPVALPERQSILILGPNGTLEGTPLEIRPSVQPTIQQITPVQPPTIPATPVQPPQPPQPPQALQDYNREGYFKPKLVRNKQIQPRCWELLLCSGKCTLSQYRKKKCGGCQGTRQALVSWRALQQRQRLPHIALNKRHSTSQKA